MIAALVKAAAVGVVVELVAMVGSSSSSSRISRSDRTISSGCGITSHSGSRTIYSSGMRNRKGVVCRSRMEQ